jgi:hypothetical protein
MKLLTVLATIVFATTSSIAQVFHVGERMIVHALTQVHSGKIQVEGDGLQAPVFIDVSLIDVKGKGSQAILSKFNLDKVQLQIVKPSSYITTCAQIMDRSGNTLFSSVNTWRLERVQQNDGSVRYDPPVWSGNLWFQLADVRYPFSGKSATAYLNTGEIISLAIEDGFVIVPGVLAYSEGYLEVVDSKGISTGIDIKTGASASRPVRFLSSLNGVSFDQVQNLGQARNVMEVDTNQWQSLVYEMSSGFNGIISMNVIQQFLNYPGDTGIYPMPRPIGVWYYNLNEWKYITPNQNGSFQIPVLRGRMTYFYFIWDEQSGKG